MDTFVSINGSAVDYTWIRRRRKTAALHMDPQQGLVVITPSAWKREQVEELLERKIRWILEKRQKMTDINERQPIPVFHEGAMFLLGGQWHPMQLSESPHSRSHLHFDEGGFYLVKGQDAQEEDLRQVFISWYKSAGQRLVEERIVSLAPSIAGMPKLAKVKEQKKRWGSCTHDNQVLFNWRLVMAPLPVLDSIVVHELCHMIHKDHSRAFWALVHAHDPDYKTSKDWLAHWGRQLFWMG
jgi:hypothetical protein